MTSPLLAAARVRACEVQPYLSAVLWRLRFVEVDDDKWPADALGDIGTDERGVCLVKKALVKNSLRDELAADLVHEAYHLLLNHHTRRGAREAERWNVAGDLSINDDVRAIWPLFTKRAVFAKETFGLEPNKSSEWYYENLPQSLSKRPACGSCAGNRHEVEGQTPQSERDVFDPIEWEPVRVAVAAEVRKHKQRGGRGSVPNGIDRWAEETFQPSPVDWRRALSVSVKTILRQSGAWDFTYARPSRRSVPNIVLPSMRAPKLRGAVVVDTSASRSDDDLARDLDDIRSILKVCGSEVEVISTDAQVQSRTTVRSASQAGRSLRGGGGTTLEVGIEEATRPRRGEKPDVIVVLTDGYSTWPETAPKVPVVIVLPEGGPEVPKWARRVERCMD